MHSQQDDHGETETLELGHCTLQREVNQCGFDWIQVQEACTAHKQILTGVVSSTCGKHMVMKCTPVLRAAFSALTKFQDKGLDAEELRDVRYEKNMVQ